MKKLMGLVLFSTACRTTPTPVVTPPTAICLEPKEIVTVVTQSCGVQVEFTPAVDQTVAGVVVCVLDPAGPAMLCMTPAEASTRAARSQL